MAALTYDDVVVHGNAERLCDLDDRLGHPDIGLRWRRIAGGVVVHQNHWAAKKRQRRLRTLLWADNTSQKDNFAGYQPWNECWRAILSDCLEQQFEMVARPGFEPIQRDDFGGDGSRTNGGS